MSQANFDHESIVRLVVGGDVMLGRMVKQAILRYGPEYPLEPVAGLMRQADLTLVNLECALTSSSTPWQGAPKAFYFGAPPSAIQTLTHAGVDMVSLANNHVLDFGVAGLRETIRALRRDGIRFAGAGNNIDEASSASIIACGPIRFGMVLRPTMKFRRLAHAAIKMGWKILFGHSAHVFQGIEIHDGCPIMYAAGDLVDDYYVDPEFKNDHQLLFELELTRSGLRRISLHPVFIEACQARFASEEQCDTIANRMAMLCAELGTRVHQDAGKIWIDGNGA
jgi:poly-gamma-glutamate capsule biosynthesis protein CapA/YwtB (metallophosphatase superfamily)